MILKVLALYDLVFLSELVSLAGCPVITRRLPQKQREITLKGFRNGDFGVLVATNVPAHGLDILEVDLVVQSSPPKHVQSYIHRYG